MSDCRDIYNFVCACMYIDIDMCVCVSVCVCKKWKGIWQFGEKLQNKIIKSEEFTMKESRR